MKCGVSWIKDTVRCSGRKTIASCSLLTHDVMGAVQKLSEYKLEVFRVIFLWMWSFTACIIIRSSTNRTTNTTPDSKVIILGISNIVVVFIIINSH